MNKDNLQRALPFALLLTIAGCAKNNRSVVLGTNTIRRCIQAT